MIKAKRQRKRQRRQLPLPAHCQGCKMPTTRTGECEAFKDRLNPIWANGQHRRCLGYATETELEAREMAIAAYTAGAYLVRRRTGND